MDLKVCFIVYIQSDPEKLLKTFGKWDRIDIDINSAFPTYIRRRRPIWPLKYWEWAKLTSEYVIYAISYVLLYVKSIPFSLIQHMLYLWWISNIQLCVGSHHLILVTSFLVTSISSHFISSHFIFSHFISSHFIRVTRLKKSFWLEFSAYATLQVPHWNSNILLTLILRFYFKGIAKDHRF